MSCWFFTLSGFKIYDCCLSLSGESGLFLVAYFFWDLKLRESRGHFPVESSSADETLVADPLLFLPLVEKMITGVFLLRPASDMCHTEHVRL